ncbi:hypothetical protein Cgig2_026429 [Carnegiea gigantea]|uniref:Uncharacterized protein n=1 Tax=Carnegiea gigantea TaxID=171969 RepID=A0A9Q1GMR9_9CARY|nr:hypothetical protein Cgig2_026429 [Carnegiea gigantea]
MVDTRFKASKQGEKGKHRTAEDPLWGYGGSLAQSSRENSAQSRRPQRDASALQGENARRIIETEQALQKAHNSVALLRSITTLYASKNEGVEWHEEQEKSSCPHYSAGRGSEEIIPLLASSMGRTTARTSIRCSAHSSPSNGQCQEGGKSEEVSSKCCGSPSMIELGPTMIFGLEDMHPLQTPHNDALVIQLKIATAIVRRILMNTGSFVDVITLECLKKLQHNEKDLEAINTPIVRFEKQATDPLRAKRLPV